MVEEWIGVKGIYEGVVLLGVVIMVVVNTVIGYGIDERYMGVVIKEGKINESLGVVGVESVGVI